jgi:hypothetical protein
MIRDCAHIARTDAHGSSRQSRHVPACARRSAAAQKDFASWRALSRQDPKQSANAVWVRAHPGFKSSSLRA